MIIDTITKNNRETEIKFSSHKYCELKFVELETEYVSYSRYKLLYNTIAICHKQVLLMIRKQNAMYSNSNVAKKISKTCLYTTSNQKNF